MKRPRDDWLVAAPERLPSAHLTRRTNHDRLAPTSLEALPPPAIDPYLSDRLWPERIAKALAFNLLDGIVNLMDHSLT
jgi:hypothetical protein